MFKWSSRRSGARGTGSSGADVEVVQLSHVQVVQPLELCNCHMFKLCSSINGVAIMVQWCSCNSNTSARVQWCSCRSGAPVIWSSGAAVTVMYQPGCSGATVEVVHLSYGPVVQLYTCCLLVLVAVGAVHLSIWPVSHTHGI